MIGLRFSHKLVSLVYSRMWDGLYMELFLRERCLLPFCLWLCAILAKFGLEFRSY